MNLGKDRTPVVPVTTDPLTMALLDKVRPLLAEALDTVKGVVVLVGIIAGVIGGLVAFALGALLALALR